MQHRPGNLPRPFRPAILALTLLIAPTAWASEEECPPACGLCALKKTANALVPGITWGADLRLRSEYLDDATLEDEGDNAEVWRQRFRARVWATAKPTDALTFATRLTTEPWYFSQPDSKDEQFIRNEALFDQLYVDWKGNLVVPAEVRIGRQDIRLGDGWLVRRGTPLDSSRTNFFDAVKGTLTLDDHHSDIELVYLRNHSNSSWLARPFNDDDLDLSEQDATGVIVYGRQRRWADIELDSYFIFKHNDRVLSKGSDADIYTFGTRAAGRLHARWTYTAEFAPQFGYKDETNLDAFGGRALFSYALEDTWQSSLRLGYEYRSGDDDPNGAFDILWGRNGDNLANIFGSLGSLEGQPCHPSNFHSLRVGWTGQPTDALCLACDYYPMFRDKNPYAGTTGFSDDGRFRGHLVTGSVNYRISRHARTHVLSETFFPGSYYAAPLDQTATFLRWEVMLVW